MNAIDPSVRPVRATRLLAGVSVPDTLLVSRAIEYAREHSEPYLFNHVMRSWLFAVTLAQRNRAAHDEEVLAVATILHDLGLAAAFNGPLRFEVEGANAARAFAQNLGVVLFCLGEPTQAAEHYESAMRLSIRAGRSSTHAQARNNLVRAVLDYQRSLVDFETVQEAPLR